MARTGVQLDPKTFSCCLCLDLVKDALTTSCGHSYCSSCLHHHWDAEDEKMVYSCPQCSRTFTSRPDLDKNTTLAALVETLRNIELQAAPANNPANQSYAGGEDVACDVCTGKKLKALKSCLDCQASYCVSHLQPHRDNAPLRRHKLLEPTQKLQEVICPCHNEVMKMFCRTDKQNICFLCSVDEHKDHDIVTVAALEKDRELEETTEKIQEMTVSNIDVLVPDPEPRNREDFLKYSRQITLDPNTVNRWLMLSEENRTVTNTGEDQSYSYHPDRFTDFYQVLSKEGVSGRCYWEVEWKGKVNVAMAYRNISKGSFESIFGQNKKSWCRQYHNTVGDACADVSVPTSNRIGVYLDHRAGLLCFYSVSEDMTLIKKVQTTFTKPLHAGLWVSLNSSAELMKPPEVRL